MEITLMLLAPALLILLLCWLNRNLDAPEDQPLEVRQPGVFQGMFLFGVLGFAVIAIAVPLTTGETEYSPYLAFLALLGSVLSPFAFISGIRYGAGGLTIRTFFGRVHELRWEDVTTVQGGHARTIENRQDGFIIADGRKFYVNYAMPDAEDFIRRARQECRQRGVDPTLPRRKNDLFHGNVPNAGTILFGWWFVGVFFALFMAALVALSILNPEEADDSLMLAAMWAVMLIWWILRCLRGVKVSREPEKYGQKVFEGYFGKGSWPQ